MYVVNIIAQAIVTLLIPAALMFFISWLFVAKCGAPEWLYAVLITLGIMYILIHKKTVAALEALKRQQQILNDINTQMRPSSYQTPMYQQSYQQGYQQSYPQYPYQQ